MQSGSAAGSGHLQLVQACQRRFVERDGHPIPAVAAWDHGQAAAVVAERAALHAAPQVHHLDAASRLLRRVRQRWVIPVYHYPAASAGRKWVTDETVYECCRGKWTSQGDWDAEASPPHMGKPAVG
jgi:hypothetical protein